MAEVNATALAGISAGIERLQDHIMGLSLLINGVKDAALRDALTRLEGGFIDAGMCIDRECMSLQSGVKEA